MRIADRLAQCGFRVRDHYPVHVIVHQAVRQHLQPVPPAVVLSSRDSDASFA